MKRREKPSVVAKVVSDHMNKESSMASQLSLVETSKVMAL